MTKEERLKVILDDLDEIAHFDRNIIQPRNLANHEPLEPVAHGCSLSGGTT